MFLAALKDAQKVPTAAIVTEKAAEPECWGTDQKNVLLLALITWVRSIETKLRF